MYTKALRLDITRSLLWALMYIPPTDDMAQDNNDNETKGQHILQ